MLLSLLSLQGEDTVSSMCQRVSNILSTLLLRLFRFLLLYFPICKSAVLDSAPGCRLKMEDYMFEYEYYKKGEIIIGGIFTVHSEVENVKYTEGFSVSRLCLGLDSRHYQQFLAFIIAIGEINKNKDILPNVTLGYHVYNSCGHVQKVIKDVLHIISGPEIEAPNYVCMEDGKVAGFIGDHHSVTTLPMAQLLHFFGYTQVSYGARDQLLSDRTQYPNFFRTVQNNQIHHVAIAKLLRHFGWNWVGIITSDDDAGNRELEHLRKQFNKYGICVEFEIKVSKSLQGKIPLQLKTFSTEIVIFCGTYNNDFIHFLRNVVDILRYTTIILPASWSDNKKLMLSDTKQLFDYSLTFSLPLRYIPRLHKLVYGLHPFTHPTDIFLEEIWMYYFGCLSRNAMKNDILYNLIEIHLRNCTGRENLGQIANYSGDPISYRVYIAVLSMAQALHDANMALNTYGEKHGLNKFGFENKLKNFINKIKLIGPYNETISFDDNGDWPETLNIGSRFTIQIRHNGSTYATRYVGRFTSSLQEDQQLNMLPRRKIKWKYGKVPKGLCSPVCLPGTRKALKKGYHTCCYDCIPCSEGEITHMPDSENCQKCPDDEWPNEKKYKCVPRMTHFLSYEDIIASVLSVISGLFFILAFSITGIFVYFQDTPIVKANNRNLSFVLLISLKLSFLSVYLFIGCPVDITCMLRQISFGIMFTVAVSSILAKTIIVHISFKATRPGSSWRKWLGFKLPNSVVLICSFIQVLTSTIWLSVSPPFQEYDRESFPGLIIIQCNEGSVLAFYSILGYMGFLAALCFVLAFMVRSLPDIFNEAKYITFSMLVFCSVWVCAIPAYLSSKGKDIVTVEIFAILASGIGILSCIFFPKCYNIILRPEKNIKKHLLEKSSF